MKKLLIILALAISAPTAALEKSDCEWFAVFAENAMELRQMGMEKNYLLSKFKGHQLYFLAESVVDSAWTVPIGTNEFLRNRAVTEFSKMAKEECEAAK